MQNWSTILKNFISLSGGELLSKGIAFITTIYLARVISPEGFGILGYATAFVSYFLLFIDFGFDIISVKKIANDKNIISKYINNIISFRILLASAIFFVLVVVILFINETLIIKLALLITGLNLFVQSFATEFVFQATEKINYLSIKVVVKNIIILVLVLLFVKSISDVLIVVGISILANLIMSIWLFKKYTKLFAKFTWSIDRGFLKSLFLESFPLIISSFMITIYYNLDMVMLGNIKTQTEVGIYNAAYKIFMIGLIPLAAIVRIFLPSLSKINESKVLKRTIKNYGIMMLSSGILIAVVIFFSAKVVVNFAYGNEYIASVFPLMILALNVLVISVNVFFGNPLTVWGKQKAYSVAITFGAIVNIILNLVLIPKYSYNGAALATLLSEVAVFIGVFYLFNVNLKKIITQG
ncbi:MAG: flippase [Bacteroidetes bacterium]|nr:flippase [Bacteroidota bacterium]MBU1114768.1 flippase [Bacteroidota bacterium]MBU1797791.1 flippase [Bacteroidota bacterium]